MAIVLEIANKNASTVSLAATARNLAINPTNALNRDRLKALSVSAVMKVRSPSHSYLMSRRH